MGIEKGDIMDIKEVVHYSYIITNLYYCCVYLIDFFEY